MPAEGAVAIRQKTKRTTTSAEGPAVGLRGKWFAALFAGLCCTARSGFVFVRVLRQLRRVFAVIRSADFILLRSGF
jgi:hypothetical protein